MSTSKPLNTLVPELLSYIQVMYQNQVIYSRKLMDIYQGNLLKYVEESLALELNPRALARSKGRIPPINVLNKVIGKLSKVYIEPAIRDAGDNSIDQELLAYYEDKLDVNNQLATANELLNLHKYFAIEPYINNGVPSMRVLPADKFLVWSDNSFDPTAMTVFIKFMGSITKVVPTTDKNGVVIKNAENVVREVALYHVYSDESFMIMDADGVVSEYRDNPYGKIPFVYCSSSSFELIPTPDADNLAMAVLIPKLLTDINYATQFQSHSIVYGIDIETSNLDNNPDAFWVINSVEGEGKKPMIGTIKPEVDIDKVITLISTEMSMWLDSKGIKVGSIGQANVDNAASGIAKLIDEGDASSIGRKQVNLFRKYESDLWNLIVRMHGYWASSQQLVDVKQDFSLGFKPAVTFAENKIVVDTKTTLEELKIMFDLGLITPKQALFKLNPDFTDDQIEQLLAEIKVVKDEVKSIEFSQVEDLANKGEEPNSAIGE
jgi:hypothetical protein